MENKIELFGMLSELDTFVDKNAKEIVQEYHEAKMQMNQIRFIFECYFGKKYAEFWYDTLVNDLDTDMYVSWLYTAKHLIYSGIKVNTVDLSYSYMIENQGEIDDLDWIKIPDNNSTKIISYSGKKLPVESKEIKRWKERFQTADKKWKPMHLLMQYDREANTIPYFLFQLTFMCVFKRSNTCGITEHFLKMNPYTKFCDSILKEIKKIKDPETRLLLSYKFEKIFKPNLIYDYKGILESQYRRNYFDKVDWNSFLELHVMQAPELLDTLGAGMIAMAMCTDKQNIYLNSSEQLEELCGNIAESIRWIGNFYNLSVKYKKVQFSNMYKYNGGLEGIVNICRYNLKRLDTSMHSCGGIEELKKTRQKRIEILYGQMQDYVLAPYLDTRKEKVSIQKISECVSSMVPKECIQLFNR